jgi:hypothetical protein
MRHFHLWGFLALLGLMLVACGTGDTSVPRVETEIPAAVQAVLADNLAEPETAVSIVVNVAAPTSTAEPTRERPYRSYPAPTGYPGFRKYYQKRCYPGCHSYSTTYTQADAPTVQPTATPTVGRDRPYRSYPAPTGYPGFRVYYQKRCYPGCHTYPSTPAPTLVHP